MWPTEALVTLNRICMWAQPCLEVSVNSASVRQSVCQSVRPSVLSKPASTASMSKEENTIFAAAGRGSIADVERFMKSFIDVNAADSSGKTPIHFAAAGGHKELTDFLIANGANIQQTDRMGRTAMHVRTRPSSLTHSHSLKHSLAGSHTLLTRHFVQIAATENQMGMLDFLKSRGLVVNAKVRSAVTLFSSPGAHCHRHCQLLARTTWDTLRFTGLPARATMAASSGCSATAPPTTSTCRTSTGMPRSIGQPTGCL
jgi:hypothetical protein